MQNHFFLPIHNATQRKKTSKRFWILKEGLLTYLLEEKLMKTVPTIYTLWSHMNENSMSKDKTTLTFKNITQTFKQQETFKPSRLISKRKTLNH